MHPHPSTRCEREGEPYRRPLEGIGGGDGGGARGGTGERVPGPEELQSGGCTEGDAVGRERELWGLGGEDEI